MHKYKQREADAGAHAACPLCRSSVRTGLTPTVRRSLNTGFVSGRALHGAMVQRAAAARAAVQRSLSTQQPSVAAGNAASVSPAPLDTSSPYQQVLAAAEAMTFDIPSRASASLSE